MRSVIRLFITCIVFVLGALVVLTTETVAEELGFVDQIRAATKSGWAKVLTSGYDSAVFAAFCIFFGVALALWAEFVFRKIRDHARKNDATEVWLSRKSAELSLDCRALCVGYVVDTNNGGYVSAADPPLTNDRTTLILIFEREMAEPCAYVYGYERILFREVSSSSSHITLEFDLLNLDELQLMIKIRPVAWAELGRYEQEPNRWYESYPFPAMGWSTT